MNVTLNWLNHNKRLTKKKKHCKHCFHQKESIAMFYTRNKVIKLQGSQPK